MISFVAKDIPREMVLSLLQYEEQVKYSPEIQEIYTTSFYANQQNHIPLKKQVNIDVEIQKHVLNYYGFSCEEEDLQEYWKLPKMYWNDSEIKNSVFYMRYNIFEFSEHKPGESIPSHLRIYSSHDLTQSMSLMDLFHNKPFILLAGSMT